MGQAILLIEATQVLREGELCIIFSCDAPGCHAHADAYSGPDFILLRKEAHAFGWRQRNNKWFKLECVPDGKDPDG
jgi:hypothetical protein